MDKGWSESWYDMLKESFKETRDDFSKMVSTMSDKELHTKFDSSFGISEGCDFTAWGEKYVYFPVVYDGAESVGYAPRNICDIKTPHWGGQ